jgi:hypothetical protein
MRHGKGSECIKCGVVVLRIRQWSDKTKVCRACITRVIKTASSPSQPLVAQSPLHGFIDDAVLDIAFGDDLNRLENAIFKTMKKPQMSQRRLRTSIVATWNPTAARLCNRRESQWQSDTWGDMDKMHLVLSLTTSSYSCLTRLGVPTKFEGGKFHEMRDEYPMMNANLL